MASSTRQAFNQAFRSAADAGDKTFEFEGKKYNTKMAPPKTESNRGGARMKSGKDVMDTLPKVGKVETRELAPKKSPADRVQYDPTSSSYYADVGNSKSVKVSVPKDKGQTKGFKAEDMGMGKYGMPKGSDFIPTKNAIPGRFGKPMAKLPGRFPTKEEAESSKKDSKDTKPRSAGFSVGVGAEPIEDVRAREENLRDSIKSMANSDLTPKAGDRPTDEPAEYRKGGMVKRSRGSMMKAKGSMMKASGGMVRGAGCATKGKGKGTMY
jgi:hypothetical protein